MSESTMDTDMANTLMEISKKLHEITTEQQHFSKSLQKMESNSEKLTSRVNEINGKLKTIELYREFKEENIKSFKSWLTIIGTAMTVIAGLSSYIAYDVGLYKDVPKTSHEKALEKVEGKYVRAR